MAIGSSSKDYWVLRLAQAVENALEAPAERSRIAYLELARHYWSMHVMINGQHKHADLGHIDLEQADLERPNAGRESGPQLQCAA